MKAVILAGGEGTRLRPLTCNTPKAMVPVLNRPFLEHLIRYLGKHNVVDIILAIARSSEQIWSYFGDGSRFSANITYSVEDSSLGTAGAVRNARKFLDGTFIVLNGDTFSDTDLTAMVDFHHKKNAIVSMALTSVAEPAAYGVVETDAENRVKLFTEKPEREEIATKMTNAGIYVLDPAVLELIPPNVSYMFERDVFPALLEEKGAFYGYPSQGYRIDIGTPGNYLKLNHDLLHGYIGSNLEFEGKVFVHCSARIGGPTLVGEGCSVERNSVVEGPAVLGARCQIEEGAVVEGAILWKDCKVGRKARLRNCVVASNCHIGEESEIGDGCILGDNVTIGRNNKLSHGIRIWPNKSIEPDAISF